MVSESLEHTIEEVKVESNSGITRPHLPVRLALRRAPCTELVPTLLRHAKLPRVAEEGAQTTGVGWTGPRAAAAKTLEFMQQGRSDIADASFASAYKVFAYHMEQQIAITASTPLKLKERGASPRIWS